MTTLAYYVRGDVMYALPDPSQFHDDRLRLAIALRNQATLAGACSVCGANAPMPNREQRRRTKGTAMAHVMVHEAECLCGDDRLAELFTELGEAA
jgi:hypothetical protein